MAEKIHPEALKKKIESRSEEREWASRRRDAECGSPDFSAASMELF
jgi:hypothetical protein